VRERSEKREVRKKNRVARAARFLVTDDRGIAGIALAAVVVLVACGAAIMHEQCTFFRPPGKPAQLTLPNGVTRPGLAMELASSSNDAETVLNAGASSQDERDQNRKAMRWMQYWDFPFIAAYVTLFFLIARRGRLLGFRPLMWLARAATLTAVLAGVADVLEDFAILAATHGSQIGTFPIRAFGSWKWRFVFITAFLESPVFFAWSDLPLGGRILSLLIGAAFFGIPLLGIQSSLLNCDSGLERDVAWLFGAFSLLAIFSVWRFVYTLLTAAKKNSAASNEAEVQRP